MNPLTSIQQDTPIAEAKLAPTVATKLAAVIDIGATAIRLEIAEILDDGTIRTLDTLQKPVQLGKDTFKRGRIQQSTIEECVEVLKNFRRVMEEYGIVDNDQIRAVATSSVREAANRDTFLDRVYMATRINIDVIEEAEETRLTYMAVQHLLRDEPSLRKKDTLIVEVGGGDSELLLIQKGYVTFSNTYRLGTLRMRETLETQNISAQKTYTMLAKHIQLSIDQIKRNVPIEKVPYLIAISGDTRFAASKLDPQWASRTLTRIDIKTFSTFAKKIAPLSIDDAVRKHRLTYQEAETVGPALLAYAHLAEAFNVDEIIVPKSNLRHGLLQEAALGGTWTKEFSEQVIHSALALGSKYGFDIKHARHVADLSVQLFKELYAEHRLSPRYELLLYLAALLHEIGLFISNRSHHKHSMYLIQNSDLFGLGKHDTTLIALVARYHRRAAPQPYHEVYAQLNRDDRLAVAKMAAILRVADALDRNHMQQIKHVKMAREKNQFVIAVPNIEDLTLERLALKEKANMFEEIYGLKAVLRSIGSEGEGSSHA